MFENRPALVIGGGGAARSAVYALRTWMRTPEIYLVNRDAGEVAAVIAECTRRGFAGRLTHVASVAQAAALQDVGAVVVNALALPRSRSRPATGGPAPRTPTRTPTLTRHRLASPTSRRARRPSTRRAASSRP